MSIRAELIAETEAELAQHLAAHETETDPFWREILAVWIKIDTQWLAEMQLPLPFVLPLGLPAPLPREVV
jgi:hypothetical protein